MTSERFISELEPEKCESAAIGLRANANKLPALGPNIRYPTNSRRSVALSQCRLLFREEEIPWSGPPP
jgi:hypothetical protein